MQNNTLELVFILDKSGSMEPLTDDTIGGFNSNIAKHRDGEGTVLVTTVLFDSSYRIIHDRIPISEVPVMTRKEYAPGGNTALYDAVGSAISHIEDVHRYIRPEDVPSAVMFIIITDGMENSSREYTGNAVRSMVKGKKEKGWDFLFIGADIDAAAAASDIGIHADYSGKIRRSADGMRRAMTYAGRAAAYRRANPGASEEERLLILNRLKKEELGSEDNE